jgi:predicted transcriptional regulator
MSTLSRSARQHARIMELITADALTAQELADRIYLDRGTVNLYLKQMRADKQIHIAGHQYNPQGGRAAPRYFVGDKPDAVYVKTRAAKCGGQVAKRKRHLKKLIGERALSVSQLSRYMHLAQSQVRRYVRELRDAKEVHIGGWGQLNAGGFQPLYALGDRPDVPREKIPPAIRHKEYRDRHRDAINARRRFRDRLRANPNTWLSALGL